MKSFIDKGFNVLINDGVNVFVLRLMKYVILKFRRLFLKSDFGDWKSLKNTYNGKRIFILGNGPSLNQTPLYYLKDEYTMCFNRVNLMLDRLNWTPNFYVMTDDLLIKDMSEEVKSEIIPKVDYAFFPDIHPSNVNFRKRIGNHSNVYYLNTDFPGFQSDLPKCGINKTVVNAGIQIAVFLGFTEIYLLGIDMTFGDQKVKKENSRNWTAEKDDDPNHFDPRYFGKGRSYHNPTVHEMLDQFDKGRIFLDKIGVKIFNATIGGKLEVFERVNFSALFNFSQVQSENIFLSMVFKNNEYSSFDDVEKTFNTIIEAKDFNPEIDTFICSSDLGAKLIKRAVFSHIPLGPYKNKYIFKKRIVSL